MVEGHTRFRFGEDPTQDRIGIVENCSGRDAKGCDSPRSKPSIACFISHWSIAHCVNLAIDLDCQAGIAAEKVENVRTGGMLSPELQPFWLLAESLPKNNFGQGHFAPEPASTSDRA
jgi:hypothetical protein